MPPRICIQRIKGAGDTAVDGPKIPYGPGNLLNGSGAQSSYFCVRTGISDCGNTGSSVLFPPGMMPDVAAARNTFSVGISYAGPAAMLISISEK